jgi:SAM-dependent methyltransferase
MFAGQLSAAARGLPSPPVTSPTRGKANSPAIARGMLPSPALTNSTLGPNDTRYAQLFVQRKGRRYHRDTSLAYPLPCDVSELHRQTLRQMMLTSAFGAPFCSPQIRERPPRRVLDVGCGTGFWASQAHEYFTRMGHKNVEFVGLDIAPLAANLKEQGINWIFVQHDLRLAPLPFSDETFDFVFAKDLSLVLQTTGQVDRVMEEYMRVLKPGGILEMWECKFHL